MRHHKCCGKYWPKLLLMVVVGIGVAGFIVMSLWNWLMPALFGLKQIAFLQALGLLVLARLLFGGFHGRHGHFRRHMAERWAAMTPEEKEKLHGRFHGCCGHGKSDSEADTTKE